MISWLRQLAVHWKSLAVCYLRWCQQYHHLAGLKLCPAHTHTHTQIIMLLPWPITVIYHQPAQAHLQGHRHENTQLALMDHHGANPGPPCAWMIYLSSAIAVDQVTCHNGQAQTQYLLLFHCLLKHWLKHLEGKAVLGVLLWMKYMWIGSEDFICRWYASTTQ